MYFRPLRTASRLKRGLRNTGRLGYSVLYRLRFYRMQFWKVKVKSQFMVNIHTQQLCCISWLPPIRPAEIVGCVRNISTEAHKIWKAWALVNQILPRCFCSYGLWLNKLNHRVKQVDISEPTDINQSISMIRFYPIEVLIFIGDFFIFQ